ncbi:MAG: fibronectin/fibrinogen-binding protein [Clostridiales bacterium]|nr:fibronectin/fibrinogen-binding protein [Clostridiales bacterium]
MPLDAICLRAVVQETATQVTGARIEKIQQPARDQVVLLLRGSKRLLLCAGSNQPRLHMTAVLRDNPSQPPMFCMLLRKYLTGGRIVSITQPELERIVEITVEILDEMGEKGCCRLILEAMGRCANLILTGTDGRIIDCLRRVDLESSQDRQLLPGLYYRRPPAQGKLNPLTTEKSDFLHILDECREEQALDEWLLSAFAGFSPLMAREIVYRAFQTTDRRNISLTEAERESLWQTFSHLTAAVNEGAYTPTVLLRNGRPADYSYTEITQYGPTAESMAYDAFSALLDGFYAQREQADRVHQRGQMLKKAMANARDRLRRKLAAQEKEYAATQNRDALRLSGELITANLYRMKKGEALLQADNYYETDCPQMEIRLDPLLSPQQNAAKYFKQYNKAKTAEVILREQIEKGRGELIYLESVLEEIQEAESEQDFNDIRLELQEGGYLRSERKTKGGGFQRASRPREFRSSTGLRILVGRNNRQNDKLTGKDAARSDLWLHVQKAHGSHVILEGPEPDETSIYEAALLAAWFSQSREGQNVPVDYTPVKYVKKPGGARPGMVIYTTCRTVFVTPEEAAVKKLSAK